ncbi:MAG: hypothetical protein HY513_03060 [Candidatus Aenigmarchaeota archaeon]|nr:hypothetical protein [Candidatus Aenigmarchaeota archaeon]
MDFEDYEYKLKNYISENNITAEHIHFQNSVHTVEEAAKEANASADDFVKSVCIISQEKTIIAIILGSDRADMSKISNLLGIKKPYVASPQEALERTGYPVGGTPPFGYAAIFLMDEKVPDKKFVYAGGGSPQALIKISPKEILRINKAQICDIRK